MFTEAVKKVEGSKIKLQYFILMFLFAITLRNFIEFSLVKPYAILEQLLHYSLFYICLAMSIIILFYLLTKESIDKIAKVVLPSFLVLILAPIIDLIFFGKAFQMSYMLPGIHNNLLTRFLTFFGSFTQLGITPGMRIEIALVLLASFFYFKLKTRKIPKSIISSFSFYALIFLYCAMPFILKSFLNIFNIAYKPSDILFSYFYLLLAFMLLVALFYIWKKKTLVSLLLDIRPFRLIHFEFMFILGIFLAGGFSNLLNNSNNLFRFIFILFSIAFAWLFSVMVNNIEDINIDKIANKNRPLVKGTISLKEYKKSAYLILFLALAYSITANLIAFFLILWFIVSYLLYSMRSLRLKRVPFFSKLIITLNSLVLVFLGYIFVGKGLSSFSPKLILFFLIFFTACINFIDIKDYKGDKKAGIKTLPVLFGLKQSKLIIGLFFLIAYFTFPFFIGKLSIFPIAALFGILGFFVINKREYNEKLVFSLYLVSIVLLMISLIIGF